jgi:hypothetical protein
MRRVFVRVCVCSMCAAELSDDDETGGGDGDEDEDGGSEGEDDDDDVDGDYTWLSDLINDEEKAELDSESYPDSVGDPLANIMITALVRDTIITLAKTDSTAPAPASPGAAAAVSPPGKAGPPVLAVYGKHLNAEDQKLVQAVIISKPPVSPAKVASPAAKK